MGDGWGWTSSSSCPGYLITSLLLAEDRPPGNIVSFWGRRARRLLPAVLVLLVALSVYAAAGGPGLVPAQLRSPALATLFYVANWQQIAAGHSYFARYLSVSPLQQTWSLAIEEQYYLVWPLLVAVVALSARARGIRQWRADPVRRHGVPGRGIGGVDGCGRPPLRGQPRLPGHRHPGLGAPPRGSRGHGLAPGPPVDTPPACGPSSPWSGLAGLAVGASVAGGPPGWIWDGGLVAIAGCAALLIVGALRAPDGVVGRGAGPRPGALDRRSSPTACTCGTGRSSC